MGDRIELTREWFEQIEEYRYAVESFIRRPDSPVTSYDRARLPAWFAGIVGCFICISYDKVRKNVLSGKILMACANYWTSPFQVGSHHIARGFVKAGWTVGFISDPISPFHPMGHTRHELAKRFDLYRAGGCSDLGGKLWAYVPGALLTPQNRALLRSQTVERSWSCLTWPPLASYIERHGFGKVDLVYCDSPKHMSWMHRIHRARTVYRIADNMSGFARTTAAARATERLLAGSADLVIYTARTLESYVKALNPRRMAYVPNGVDFAHFAKDSVATPKEYESIPRPIAVYAGYMDAWFGYELLNQVVAALPDVSFVLIGGSPTAHSRLALMPNLHLLGTRPFSRLPEFLRGADVGMIPFDVHGHPTLVNSIHPLKLYEYLAAGLPVVATRWRELDCLKSPAVLCESAEEFAAAVKNAVSQPPARAIYKAFAEQHDWRHRVSRLLDLLDVGRSLER